MQRARALLARTPTRHAHAAWATSAHFDHPYRTIDPSFEATIVDALADLAEKEQLYKGCARRCGACTTRPRWPKPRSNTRTESRPRSTCASRQTTRSATTCSCGSRASSQRRMRDRSRFLIWTTTPWTLPANVAIALQADATVRPLPARRRTADPRRRACAERAFARAPRPPARAAGEGRRANGSMGASVRHPFMDRDSAARARRLRRSRNGNRRRAHRAGARRRRLRDRREIRICRFSIRSMPPATSPTKPGRTRASHIFDANEHIVDDLRRAARSSRAKTYEHSYPHCWRCHNPVIFRATAQWFIAMDQTGCASAIDRSDSARRMDSRTGARRA